LEAVWFFQSSKTVVEVIKTSNDESQLLGGASMRSVLLTMVEGNKNNESTK